MFDSITSAAPHIQSGKLRALGVTSAKRSATLPNVPTIAEAGVPATRSRLVRRVRPGRHARAHRAEAQRGPAGRHEAAGDPGTLRSHGAEPIGSTPAQLAAHLDKEMARWGKLIKERNIRMD